MTIEYRMPGGEDFAFLDQDRSAIRIGQRIKTIRTCIGLSRQELGEKIGLSADRILQYETGRRKPKIPLLKQIADALGVSPKALTDPNCDSYVGAMFLLFEMEEKMGLRIVQEDGAFLLKFGNGTTDGINRYIAPWYEKRKELEEAMPHLSDEERQAKIMEYNDFEWNYPPKRPSNDSH